VDMIVAAATNRIHSIQASGVLAWLDDFLYLPEALYVIILVWLIFSGPGRYSIDGLIARRAGWPCGLLETPDARGRDAERMSEGHAERERRGESAAQRRCGRAGRGQGGRGGAL